jgi:hypothetical protein
MEMMVVDNNLGWQGEEAENLAWCLMAINGSVTDKGLLN